jgi:SET domain-containing protein|tara:strand:+ start:1433 stop:1861 length:429 start_codon:yes stop_codon:yes gene_type:complete
MYRPLPDFLTIKKSPIEGLGLYATQDIKANSFIGLTHVQDNNFDNGYIRTPLGGFYNHSNNPNVRRVVSDQLPRLKPGDLIDDSLDATKIPDGKANRENLYPKVQGKYMFLVSTKNIKAGEEITANYNLYTYPKTGIGIQAL